MCLHIVFMTGLLPEYHSASVPIKRVFNLIYDMNSQRFFALHRADDKTWGLPGGKVERHEIPLAALLRETEEEVGLALSMEQTELLYFFEPVANVGCHVYLTRLDKGFEPDLNIESLGYKWCLLDDWPEPAHPQMRRVLNEIGKTISHKVSSQSLVI